MGGGLAVSVPVLRLPPAIAATEELYCTSDGHFSIAQAWVLKQQSKPG